MSKPLTLLNREDKGDVDFSSRRFVARKLSSSFPSYFTDFCVFLRFLMLRMNAAFRKHRVCSESKIPLAAAFMAIV
jgi:hypothetical protein